MTACFCALGWLFISWQLFLTCEQQTHFRSWSDDRKCVCGSQATDIWCNRVWKWIANYISFVVNETGNKMDRQTSRSCMVIFARSISVHTIKAWRINVKGEMFIWEWDKENVRVPFSDKNLSEIRNATSWVKTFQITKSKHRQDVHDSRYTKTIHCFF